MITANLLTEIMNHLKNCGKFSNIRFTEEYPYFYKETPLKKITVSVGLEEATIKDASIGNVLCIENGNPIYGRQSEYRISLLIHLPLTMDGKKGLELFTKLLDELVFCSDYNIVKAGCRSMKSSRDMGSKILEGWFSLKDVYTLQKENGTLALEEDKQ